MGVEDQLHRIIIHSKVIMKSPFSSAAIRKKGSPKGGNNVMGREVKQRNQKWIKSAMILWMAVKGTYFLVGFSPGFSL